MDRILTWQRRAACLTMIGLLALGALALHPMVTSAQDTAILQIPVPGRGFNFRISPDNKTVATYEMGVLAEDWAVDRDLLPIRLFDITTDESIGTLRGQTDYTGAIAFSSDGGLLASVHQNGDLKLWDMADQKLVKTIDTGNMGAGSLLFFPGSMSVAVNLPDTLRAHLLIWDLDSGFMTASLARHSDTFAELRESTNNFARPNPLAALALSPDGKTMAAASANEEIVLWDVASKQPTSLVPPSDKDFPSFGVRKLAFTADGQRLIFFNQTDKQLHVWDLTSGKETDALDIGAIDWALAPDGDTIAWARIGDTTAQMAKISAPNDVTTINLPVEKLPKPTLEFTADGKRLVIGLFKGSEGPDNQILVVPVG